MPYKIRQAGYNYARGRAESKLRDTDGAILDAIFTSPAPRSSSLGDRERKGTDDKIKALGSVVSRLMATLLDKNVLTPDDITNILGWECDFEGEFVEVPAENES